MENRAAKRLALIAGAVAVVGVGAYLMLSAFNENLVFFYSPMQVQAQEAPKGRLAASYMHKTFSDHKKRGHSVGTPDIKAVAVHVQKMRN